MKNFAIRLAAGAAVCVSAGLCAAPARAAFVFGQQGTGVWDQTSNLYWDSFSSVAAGEAAGFRAATVGEVSALFDDRVADVQRWMPGIAYTPGSGSYSASWAFGWTGPSTPLPLAFIEPPPCDRPYCGSGGGPSATVYDLAALADAGGGGFATVSLHATYSTSQYGYSIAESGSILASGNGSSYLMVKAVPEPGTYALVGIGLAGAAWVARRRRAQG